jgi:flagella basal body P-ring formation protein FlgA
MGLAHIIKGLCLGLLLAPAVLMAETVHSLAAIQQHVEAFLLDLQGEDAAGLEIHVNPLDSRLRLANCDAKLEAFLASGSRALGNTSVGVRCPGSQPWTVYLSAQVRSFGDVLVANRFLPRGTLLTQADLSTERRDLTTLPAGYETDASRLLGKRLRRSLREQTVIPPQALEAPKLVNRGDRVTIVVNHAGMQVTANGTALQDGVQGEYVRVRNQTSERIIEGEVVDARRVQINP